MKLVIFNGSPRNKKSNSGILIEQFLNGYAKVEKESAQTYNIANREEKETQADAFDKADSVIIIFPLYTDMMPGIVKEFIEDIGLKRYTNKKVGFIVQSGFPEPAQSFSLEKYLKKLTTRLGCDYLGTVIKGGVEGIQVKPPNMTKKLYADFELLGEFFAKTDTFDEAIVKKFRNPERLSAPMLFIFKIMIKLGLANFYWHMMLKKHNAKDRCFDRPYEL